MLRDMFGICLTTANQKDWQAFSEILRSRVVHRRVRDIVACHVNNNNHVQSERKSLKIIFVNGKDVVSPFVQLW